MKDILFSEVGLWSSVTLVFIFVLMSFFLYKAIVLSAKPKK